MIKLSDLPNGAFFHLPNRKKVYQKKDNLATIAVRLTQADMIEKLRTHDLVSGCHVRNSNGRILEMIKDTVVIQVYK